MKHMLPSASQVLVHRFRPAQHECAHLSVTSPNLKNNFDRIRKNDTQSGTPIPSPGQLQTWARHILQLRATELVTCLPLELLECDRTLILHDFSTANAVILLQLQVKLGFWQHLPYVCFSLAHPDPGEARKGIQRARQLYSQSTCHHPLCTELFETHRDQIDQFISGISLQECPGLNAPCGCCSCEIQGLHPFACHFAPELLGGPHWEYQ